MCIQNNGMQPVKTSSRRHETVVRTTFHKLLSNKVPLTTLKINLNINMICEETDIFTYIIYKSRTPQIYHKVHCVGSYTSTNA